MYAHTHDVISYVWLPLYMHTRKMYKLEHVHMRTIHERSVQIIMHARIIMYKFMYLACSTHGRHKASDFGLIFEPAGGSTPSKRTLPPKIVEQQHNTQETSNSFKCKKLKLPAPSRPTHP